MSDDFLPDHDRAQEVGEDGAEQEDVKAPFSFKLMIALTVIYLGWRLIQGIVWLAEKLSS